MKSSRDLRYTCECLPSKRYRDRTTWYQPALLFRPPNGFSVRAVGIVTHGYDFELLARPERLVQAEVHLPDNLAFEMPGSEARPTAFRL